MSDKNLTVPLDVSKETAQKIYDGDAFESLFSDIKKLVDEQAPDTSTSAGRDEIRGLAAKITRTKTAVVDMGKMLTEEWRKKTAEVNSSRNDYEERLKALALEARKPLTDWEQAEEKRKQTIAENLQKINELKTLAFDASSKDIAHNLAELQALMNNTDFQESQETADTMAEAAIDLLERARAQAEMQEKQAAELERMKAEQEKQAAERAEADRIAREEQAARDKEAADRLAAKEAEYAAEREKAEKIAAEKIEQERRARAKEQAERDRIAQEKQDEADRKLAEQQAKIEAKQKQMEQQQAAADAKLAEAEAARQKEADERAALIEQHRIEKEQAAQAERDKAEAEAAEQEPETYVGTSTPVQAMEDTTYDEAKIDFFNLLKSMDRSDLLLMATDILDSIHSGKIRNVYFDC